MRQCCILGGQGITEYDLMGIGSDFAPSLKGLNEFKTKFTEEITPVAAGHDVPIKKGFYTLLTLVKSVRDKLRAAKKTKKTGETGKTSQNDKTGKGSTTDKAGN